MNTKQKQTSFFSFLCMVFVVILILSNISASNTFYINEFLSLSAAELLFPISYIVNDLLVEFYGAKTTNRVVILGLGLALFSTVFLFLTTLLPSNYVEYNTVFGFLAGGVVGITIASFIAYFVGSLINILIMEKFKKKETVNTSAKFFKRAVISSVCAEFADSLVFITFCCLLASNFYDWDKLISFVLTITSIKLVVEIAIFPLTNYFRKLAIKKNFVEKHN